MNAKILSRPAVVMAVSALGLLLGSVPAQSATRHAAGAAPAARAAKHPAPRGNFERQTVRQRTADGFTRNTTVTNGQGQTATRDVTVARDAAAGTVIRSVDASGFNGRTHSVDSTTTRTDNGFERSTTVTGPNGNTRTRDVTVVRDPAAGTVTTTVIQNGGASPNGG